MMLVRGYTNNTEVHSQHTYFPSDVDLVVMQDRSARTEVPKKG